MSVGRHDMHLFLFLMAGQLAAHPSTIVDHFICVPYGWPSMDSSLITGLFLCHLWPTISAL